LGNVIEIWLESKALPRRIVGGHDGAEHWRDFPVVLMDSGEARYPLRIVTAAGSELTAPLERSL
jgi:hypothetical protein